MLVAAVLAVRRRPVLVAARRRLERARGQADHGGGRGRVESGRGRGGVHVLVRAHLLAEARATVAEPHLYPGLGQFGPATRDESDVTEEEKRVARCSPTVRENGSDGRTEDASSGFRPTFFTAVPVVSSSVLDRSVTRSDGDTRLRRHVVTAVVVIFYFIFLFHY